jgi:hypothetical protein
MLKKLLIYLVYFCITSICVYWQNITQLLPMMHPLCVVIFMFDYAHVLMIVFAYSNCYNLQLIVTKYIWAELIFNFLLIYFEWIKCMDRSAGMCWDFFLLWRLQWTLYGLLTRGGCLQWRFESHNGMVCFGRASHYGDAYRAVRGQFGKGWATAATQNTKDLKNWKFFTASALPKCGNFI